MKDSTAFAFIVIILLILAAILGLTYLLYSDSDGDGVIGINITTGQCKIDIVDSEGATLVGDVLDFITTEEKVIFRPGSLYYTESFAVQNIGNIPLKFRISVSEDEELNGATLEDAFDIYIVKDPSEIGNGEQLTAFTGALEVGETSEYYCMVIRMKEDAGNDFQNKTYTGIGITVYAVQPEGPLE